jgi:L-threonine-O-3-phosphate decarboxylase
MHGGNLAWAAALAGCAPSDILDFSASINPLGIPPGAIATLQQAISGLVAYPDPSYAELRLALSQHHQLPPDYLLPGNGAAELLTWACRELAALDTTILLTPAFSDYDRALNAFGANVLRRSLLVDGLLPSPTLLPKILCPHSFLLPPCPFPRCGLLLNTPHNPTGRLFDRSDLLPMLQQLELVVVDEAFMDFLPPDQQQSLIEWVSDYPNLVVLRSLTKFYSLPGLRLGYAIAHPERLQRWQQWRDPWAVNGLAAKLGSVLLDDRAFQQQTWAWLAAARPQLFQGLAALPGCQPYPSAANFLLVRCDRSVVELQTQLLKQHRILIRDCLSFPELGDRYFRVAIRSPTENQRLLDALDQVLQGANHGRDEP